MENLFLSWQEFRRGKRGKYDVQEFERKLEDNLFQLNQEFAGQTYRHGKYTPFTITDPKVRRIHKAGVRDRIVHHAVYRVLYPLFDPTFIFDSYSCRVGKGTHAAVNRLEVFVRKISRNYTRPCWALKCDIRRFFDSVDHDILYSLVEKKIADPSALQLTKEIIESFSSTSGERERERVGIPLGNLTSQIFANIYLNDLDQFVKHRLGLKYYLRYCDDFVILDSDPERLKILIQPIGDFLAKDLKLSLHQDKIIIRKLRQGIDFLGYVVLPHYRVLRTRTKRRMLRRVNGNNVASYQGLLKHCNGYTLRKQLDKRVSLGDDTYN